MELPAVRRVLKSIRAACNTRSAVLDIGFWSRAERDMARTRAAQLGMCPVVYYIHAPDDILKQRISRRSGAIAENNIKNFDTTKKLFQAPQPPEDFILINNF